MNQEYYLALQYFKKKNQQHVSRVGSERILFTLRNMYLYLLFAYPKSHF